jgi:hypothetical protein
MPGNYAKPFRPLPANSNQPYAHPNHLSGCDAIPRWQNVTQVRKADWVNPADHSAGVTITNVTPFPRVDTTFDTGSSGTGECAAAAVGTCGMWLANGDLNGVVEQEVQALVDDIMACAGNDATHNKVDHNCYHKSGTKDFRKCRQIGAKWNVAMKPWHGRKGFLSNDICGSVNDAPDQVRYRTAVVTYSALFNYTTSSGSSASGGVTGSISATVDRYTGIVNCSGYFTENVSGVNFTYRGVGWGPTGGNYSGTTDVGSGTFGDTLKSLVASGGECLNDLIPLGIEFPGAVSDGFTSGNPPASPIHPYSDYTGVTQGLTGWSGSNSNHFAGGGATIDSEWQTTVQRSNTNFSCSETISSVTKNSPPGDINFNSSVSISIALSDPYTAADLLEDFKTLLDNYDLTPNTDYPWRTDEELANAPLVCFDEVPYQVSQSYTRFMDDYSQPQNGDGSWPQRAWLDPNNYFWVSTAGVGQAMNTAGGNTLVTGLRTGAILSHNPAGYDRHFWFGFNEFEQFPVYDPDSGSFLGTQWLNTAHGGFSDSALPETTLRWQDKFSAQYDGQLANVTPPPGNLPKSWIRELGGVLVGGKYVETRLTWPSVNFGRPYGVDKFAVDQTTVCVVLSAGVMSFTGNATNAMATGDYVMVGDDGIYQITVTPSSGAADSRYAAPLDQFTYTLGSKLADIPSGCDIGAGYIGKMRFWTAPPFGLLAASGVWNSGTNKTTFTIPATPYWVSVSGGAMTLAVDLYAPDASNGNPHTLLAASVTLTKTNVGDLTATVPDTDGSLAAAKFLIPHLHYSGVQFLPEYDDDRPKGDFVQLQWAFNNRAAQSGYTSPPTWYDGIAGVTGISVTDANLKFSPCCPQVVGFVPFYQGGIMGGFTPMGGSPMSPPAKPVESFSVQNLAPMPDVFQADDLYGGYWLGSAETTMVDPFWQAPFKPDAVIVLPDVLNWTEDDGTGNEDTSTTSDGGATINTQYYAHHPLVEARATRPNNLGWAGNETPPALPSGVSLTFDTSANSIPPPYWPNGIPCGAYNGGDGGGFSNVVTTYGFYLAACATIAGGGRFAGNYQKFVSC